MRKSVWRRVELRERESNVFVLDELTFARIFFLRLLFELRVLSFLEDF